MTFPVVKLERRAGGLALAINGKRHLPLIMAFARTHYMARGKPDFDYAHDVVYDQMRRVYDAGIRLYDPCMPEIGWGPDGDFDYGNFDTVLRRLVEVMPEAYFILRVIIPPPPLPPDEQIQVSRRPGDTSDAKSCQVFDQISLFSETYAAYAPGAMAKVMEHLVAMPEAGRVIGTTICGAGFEWNWGNPGGNWGLMMDICPAVTREFGRFLERKYLTVEALRAAWGDPAADFANPPLPGIEERTHSDVGGFRDPSQPRSRWIQDFLDCYNDHPTHVLTMIFDRLAPHSVDATPSSRSGAAGSGGGAASTAGADAVTPVDATLSSRSGASGSGGGAASTNWSALPHYFDPHEPIGSVAGGNLPHWRQDGATYFVTFRTADSMPQERVELWSRERDAWLASHPEPHNATLREEYHRLFTERWQNWLDESLGACLLARPEVAAEVERCMRHDDGTAYRLGEFVVMPNHVHALVTPLGKHTLSSILQTWKSVTGHTVCRLTGTNGPFWQKESFDHIVRNADQHARISEYIRQNPNRRRSGGGAASTAGADAVTPVDATPSSRSGASGSGGGAASTAGADAVTPVDATPSSRSGASGSGGGAASTKLFHGVFHLSVMNTAFSGVQTMPGVFRPILEHPALGFVTCCLTYCDRKAGGVSVYMNAAYRSHDLHGKLAIGEADIRPGTAGDGWNEASLADGVASMRREFAVMALVQRHGLWYFDMPGGWFDRPELIEELKRQQRVGEALLETPHTRVAEALVVFENRSWKYFGLAERKLALHAVWSGENQQILSDMTQDNIERIQRLGAPNDAIVAEDFLSVAPVGPTGADAGPADPRHNDYKLLIFPFSFLCDPAARTEIHRRVEAGATALFLFAAGITDGDTASQDNMARLLGMRVRVEAPGPLAATLDSLALRRYGLEGADPALGNPKSVWHRFVIDDPAAEPLGRYADGAVAAARVARGKGHIIFSAVSAAPVALYKLAATLAGVHLYSDTDDALYASGEFLVLHTRTAGAKRLRFPRVVAQVTEVFTGEVICRDASEVTIDLPAKTTAVYQIGCAASARDEPAALPRRGHTRG